MATTTKYELDKITPHYWAEASGFVAGRDAMGIQNSSVAIYTNILPGITNVSERIRYYGFYSWLLYQYDLLQEPKDNPSHQYNFMRRGELVIAFLMQYREPDYAAVPGKAFARDFFEMLKSDGIDLTKAANKGGFLIDYKDRQRSHWKFVSGAFGQYYIGAMSVFGLAEYDSKESYFFIREKGIQLAKIWEQTIPKSQQQHMLSIVKNEYLTLADLDQLTAFDISTIEPKSKEWQFYIDMLTGPDESMKESCQRKDSLLDFIKICNTENQYKKDYLLGEYYFYNPEEVDRSPIAASLAWYTYYSQERFHVSIEFIFDALLRRMNTGTYHINEFVTDIVSQFISDDIKEVTVGAYMDSLDLLEVDLVEVLWKSKKASDWSAVYRSSIDLLLSTYLYTADKLDQSVKYLQVNHIDNKRGAINEWHRYIEVNKGESLMDFFHELVMKILNDHQLVAYNKLGNGEMQVHKFIIEHNHLCYVDTITPRYTTPRLKSVKYFLEDLSLIDRESGRSTDLGNKLVNDKRMQS